MAEPRDDGALSATEARQGKTLHHMRYVLGISLTLAIVALVVVFLSV